MARITIVPEDGVVLVDGDAREISTAGIDPRVHAVQWFGTSGEVELKDPQENVSITDFSPYQVFVDRWNAAAPPPPPPPTPQKRRQDVRARLTDEDVFIALVRTLAIRFGVTETQMQAEIEGNTP